MKANAPEKIYLDTIYPDNGVLPGGLHYTPSPTDIKYIRADAFIDKAEAWLIKNQKGFILTDKDIKDFKYFMKEEKI